MTEITEVATAIHGITSTTNVSTPEGTVRFAISLDMPDSLDNSSWEFFQDIKRKLEGILVDTLKGSTVPTN